LEVGVSQQGNVAEIIDSSEIPGIDRDGFLPTKMKERWSGYLIAKRTRIERFNV